jgi:hypothetical protein
MGKYTLLLLCLQSIIMNNLEELLNSVSPNLVNGKKVAVLGAGNLAIPIMLGTLFNPQSIYALDTDPWKNDFSEVRERVRESSQEMELYHIANFSRDEFVKTNTTPWHTVFCNIYLESLENPLETLEHISCVTANTLIVLTHLSIGSKLPVCIDMMYPNPFDRTGVYWHLSEGIIDRHLQYVGFHNTVDLSNNRRFQDKTQSFVKSLKDFFKEKGEKSFQYISSTFVKNLIKLYAIASLGKLKISTVAFAMLATPKFYCKIWTKP